MSEYLKSFDETKCMSILIKKDHEMWEKYKICHKLSNNIKKEFDSESMCDN